MYYTHRDADARIHIIRIAGATKVYRACNLVKEPSVKQYITINLKIFSGRKEVYPDDTHHLVSKTIPFPATSE